MTRLSDATAVRRELIEHIDTTLVTIELEADEEERSVLAAALSDSLIDAEWVLGKPGEIPEPRSVEIGPNGSGGARLAWSGEPEPASERPAGVGVNCRCTVEPIHPYDAAPQLDVITTQDDWDHTTLAPRSVVLDRDGDIWVLGYSSGWRCATNPTVVTHPENYLPLTILHRAR